MKDIKIVLGAPSPSSNLWLENNKLSYQPNVQSMTGNRTDIYVLDIHAIPQEYDWVMNPRGVVERLTPNKYVSYLDSQSMATKKIIFSTNKEVSTMLSDEAISFIIAEYNNTVNFNGVDFILDEGNTIKVKPSVISFKQEVYNTVIPAIERMLTKEKEHLNKLLEFNSIHHHEEVDSFISESKNMVSHLELRLKQYTEYINK